GTCSGGKTCVCDLIGNCEKSCPDGNCHFQCKGTSNCIFSCTGGGCDVLCANTGNCLMSCPGTDCHITCQNTGNCILMDGKDMAMSMPKDFSVSVPDLSSPRDLTPMTD